LSIFLLISSLITTLINRRKFIEYPCPYNNKFTPGVDPFLYNPDDRLESRIRYQEYNIQGDRYDA